MDNATDATGRSGEVPRTLKALVVDDEPFFTELLSSQLRTLGIATVTARTGEDAVEKFGAAAYDLVLMDIVMPGIGGLEATRRIKKMCGDRWVPVILISALADDEAVAEGLAAGADDYINKPLRAVFFQAKVRSLARTLRLRQRLEVAAGVFEHIRDGVVITDAGQHIVDVNPAFTQITGYSREELLGRTPRIYGAGLTQRVVFEDMWRQLREHGFWRGEIVNRRKNGIAHSDFVSIAAVREAGEVRQYVGILSRVNLHRDDIVTGLPGRRTLLRRLAEGLAAARRAGRRVGLLAVDIDRFKEVNEAFGFEAGDMLLRETAVRLRARVGDAGQVFRTGNDEFVVVLPEAGDGSAVEDLAEGLAALLAQPFHLGSEVVHATASIGVTFHPDDAPDAESLLTSADQALQRARSAGGGRTGYFVDKRRNEARDRRRLVDDLRRGVAEGQFSLVFQPVVDLPTRQTVKAEALLRWHHPDKGVVMPGSFMGAAERSGLVKPIGQWVLAAAASALAQVHRHRPGFRVGVNISAVQLMDAEFDPGRILDVLRDAGVPPSTLVLEFTEGLLLKADEAVQSRLARLREEGVQLALDDYGTGYSSLTYLQQFPVDILKIDQSFVRVEPADGKRRALCGAIVATGHSLGLKVVAEGIETEEQHDRLAALGCDFGQGYLYGKPVGLGEFLGALDADAARP